MTINLTSEQEMRLRAHVAVGDFASIEEAARYFIDGGLAELDHDEDDMSWAKPLVEEARAAIARGDVITLDEYSARTAALIAALKK